MIEGGWIEVAKEVAAGGFATFLVIVLIAGKYRVWMWGYHYDEMVKEKDELIAYERAEKNEWRSMAWDTRRLTDKSVTLAQKAVGRAQ